MKWTRRRLLRDAGWAAAGALSLGPRASGAFAAEDVAEPGMGSPIEPGLQLYTVRNLAHLPFDPPRHAQLDTAGDRGRQDARREVRFPVGPDPGVSDRERAGRGPEHDTTADLIATARNGHAYLKGLRSH